MTAILRHNVFYPKTETLLKPKEMLALRNRYEVFDAVTELKKIVDFVFKKDLQSHSQIIAWGLDHLLYEIKLSNSKRYIIRINNTSVGDHYFEVEGAVYKKLHENRVQDCSVYHIEKREQGNFPYDFIILDRLLDGDFEKLLLDNKYSKDEELDMVWKCGVFLRKFHSIQTENYGFFDPNEASKGRLVGIKKTWKDYFETAFSNNMRSTYDLGFIDKKLIKRSEKVFKSYEYLMKNVKPVLLHGDFCDHNIITNKKSVVGAIDLTDTMSGDPAHDMAFWLSFYDFDRFLFLVEGYFLGEKMLDYKPFIDKIYFYLLRINFSKAILRYCYGISEKVPMAIEKIQVSLNYLEHQI